MFLDLVKAERGLDSQLVESVILLAIWCQFLCIIALSSFPISSNGVTMGRMFFFGL